MPRPLKPTQAYTAHPAEPATSTTDWAAGHPQRGSNEDKRHALAHHTSDHASVLDHTPSRLQAVFCHGITLATRHNFEHVH